MEAERRIEVGSLCLVDEGWKSERFWSDSSGWDGNGIRQVHNELSAFLLRATKEAPHTAFLDCWLE